MGTFYTVMARRTRKKKLGIFDALFSPFVDAPGTMEHFLVEQRSPPHLLSCLFLLVSLVLAPPLMYFPGVGLSYENLLPLGAVLQVSLLTLLLTTFFSNLLTRIIGIPQRALSVFGALVYATCPFVSFMCVVYISNYVIMGQLTVLNFLIWGYQDPNDWLLMQFPLLIKICCCISFWVFINGIRALTRATLSSAALIATTCIPLLLGSFVLSLYCNELTLPGTSGRVIKFFNAFTS